MKILANFMTVFARIVVYDNEVRVHDHKGRFVFTLYGKMLRNFSGNDRFVNLLAEKDNIQRIVGYTRSTPGEEPSYADVVLEKRDDGGIDVGMETEERFLSVQMDIDTVYALVRACEIALSSRKSYMCERDFWVIYATVDSYKVTMSARWLVVISPQEKRLAIPREAAMLWSKVFAAADELSDCLEGSYQTEQENTVVTRVSQDIVQVSLGTDESKVKYRFSFVLCMVLESLIDVVWHWGEQTASLESLVDVDEDDDEEGSVS